ncbi:pilin [Francisella frigiditurris]|nr:prepilin-type N-terminal cleavage/methylation domain-containing protein [Francisella frigiditurris]
MKNKQTGFSLVETVVVIAVITILAAISIPIYSNYQTRTKIGAEISKLSEVKIAMVDKAINDQGDFSNLTKPNNVTLTDNIGTINLDLSSIVSGGALTFNPIGLGSDVVHWKCVNSSGSTLTSYQLPSECSS